jgi:hypothetical protein
VEDSESFSGAGLYDSYSGCLLDDLDGDTVGPSACDPTETGERGVFRAIRRVYASFYNDNAYLERLRLGVDEAIVGMAVLVHHSTPDEIELANGVATLKSYPTSLPYLDGKLVTQLGAVSVANPDGTAVPEEVTVVIYRPGNQPELNLTRYSSLLPRGDFVIGWDQEYRQLLDLMLTVQDAYRSNVVSAGSTLDFEYKKVEPGRLEIKQVREVPEQDASSVTAYLLNQDTEFVVFQGYYAPLWATHRMKSRWILNTPNMQMTAGNLAGGIYSEMHIEHLDGANVVELSGPVSSFPQSFATNESKRLANPT